MPKAAEASDKALTSSVIKDRVAMASLRKDGTPDQSEDWEYIDGDKDAILEAEKERRAEMAVSAVDQELRGVTVSPGILAGEVDEGDGPGGTKQDPSIVKLEKAHEKAEKAGHASAEAAVNAKFPKN